MIQHIYYSKAFASLQSGPGDTDADEYSRPITYITATTTWDMSPVAEWIEGCRYSSRHKYNFYNFLTLDLTSIDPDSILMLGWEMMNNGILYDNCGKRAGLVDYINKTHRGPVVVVKQDEHLFNTSLISFIKSIENKLSAVLTCTSNAADAERLYGNANTKYIHILPGYIPNADQSIPIPYKDRSIDVLSRGRWLTPNYGSLGRMKASIGEEMLKYWNNTPEVQHLNINHSNNFRDRLFSAWVPTIKMSKSLLASPTGCNVIHGSSSGDLAPDGIIYEKWLHDYTISVRWKEELNFQCISPKMLQAINCRTVLIMYTGVYGDGVAALVPGKHYIELKRDHSNIADVWEQIQDFDALESIAEQVFEYATDIYTYEKFIRFVDCIYSGL